MKWSVGDRVYWTDSTVGRASGTVAEVGEYALWCVAVVGSLSPVVDTHDQPYPVYFDSDHPSKCRTRQRVGTWPFDNGRRP